MRSSTGKFAANRRSVLAVLASAPLACARRGLQGQYYFIEDGPALRSLEAHGRSLGELCPAWFTFGVDGILRSHVNTDLRARLSQLRLRVMPLIVNEGFAPEIAGRVLNDRALRAKALSDLVSAASRYRLAGFELDFENIAAADREAYTSFVAELAGQLKKNGASLSVAVPAPLLPAQPAAEHQPTPVSLGFDYAGLAGHSAWLSLMAYDEHTAQPGPIASGPWVEACLKHLLRTVPPKRIRLGIPFYHRRWSRAAMKEGTYTEAAQLAAARNTTVRPDSSEQEATFRFTGPEGEETVWLHNAETLRARLEMAERFELAGFAAWRLGQEDPAFWDLTRGNRRYK